MDTCLEKDLPWKKYKPDVIVGEKISTGQRNCSMVIWILSENEITLLKTVKCRKIEKDKTEQTFLASRQVYDKCVNQDVKLFLNSMKRSWVYCLGLTILLFAVLFFWQKLF